MNQENVVAFDLATDGLYATRNRIVGATFKSLLGEKLITHPDERQLLEMIWQYLRANQFEKLVGFNSDEFDMPMLIIRSMKHKVKIPNIIGNSLDLRKVLFYGAEHKVGKLIEFKRLLDIKLPESVYSTKRDILLLWESKKNMNHDLRNKLLEDVRIIWRLYENALEVGLIY